MNKKKYQIFVSSTYDDLIDERKYITQAILECDCIPAGMEMWPASSRTQWELIKSVIDESDYYLVIIAGRYGSEGIDDSGKTVSYTEMEFDYALKTRKPIIALIHSHPENIPAKYYEAEKKVQLDAFRKKAMEGRLAAFWEDAKELKAAAVAAINKEKIENPANGWMRCPKPAVSSFVSGIDIIKVHTFEDFQMVLDSHRMGNIVCLNLQSCSTDIGQRIVDIITGVVVNSGGVVHRATNDVYVISPKGIDIEDM